MLRSQSCGIEESGRLRGVRHPRIDVGNPQFRSYVDLRPPILSYSRVVRYTPITISEEELILHYNIDNENFYLDTRGIEELFHSDYYSTYFSEKASRIPLFRMKFVDGPHDKVDLLIVVSVGSGMQGSTAEGFNATLRAVMENLATLEDSGQAKWDRVVLCVVVNGREEFESLEKNGSTSVLGELERMGVYHRPAQLWERDGEMERASRVTPDDRLAYYEGSLTVDGGRPVRMHLYEATITMQGGHFPPVRLALCVKESPDKGSAGTLVTSRLSCHLWAIMGVARHLSNMSMPSRSSDEGGLPIIAMDCGMCPAADCLSVMLARLSKPKVGVVSADTCAPESLQLLEYPTASAMLRNPAFCAWLFRQRLRAVSDATMETGLGGSLSMMEGSLCGFRLDAVDPEKYFTVLTKAGNSSQVGLLAVNMYVSDGGTMLSSVVDGWRSELLPNATVVCPPLRKDSVLRNVRDFSYKKLIESSRLDVSSIFQATRRLYAAWERVHFSWSSPLRALMLVYRLIDVCVSLLALVGMCFVILLGAELFAAEEQVPLACALLLYSIVMFQLCVGVGDLTPPVLLVFQSSSLFLGILWGLGWVKLVYCLIYAKYYLSLGAVFAMVFSYAWCILLFADSRLTFKVLPLCILQWAFLYPTTSVLGSTIYGVSMCDVLPWGTPGPNPVDLRTAETLAMRMEGRSWLVAFISAVNLLPILLYVICIDPGHPLALLTDLDDDEVDDAERLKLTPITQCDSWELRYSQYDECTTLGVLEEMQSQSGSLTFLRQQPMQRYSKSILGVVGGRRAAEITATVDGAAMPDSAQDDFSYPENEDSDEKIVVQNPVFVPCPRKRQESPVYDRIVMSRIQ
ncbi:Chitin synthase, class 2 [Perkinsus olseni]|uniref:Chitin synthase, class 2 n=1 Tax=Perkinsus olseni TaxID=32597 RepID=A0A7J6MD01_PEROL|nr:Chitin synthase, class 2 [Perkinsus olseni]